jgi:iron complex outermembrane receptor protein
VAQRGCNLPLLVRVVASHSQAPLGGAQVLLEGTAKGALTNETGTAVLGGLCPGTYRVSVRFVGFAVDARTVQIPSDTVVFALAEAPLMLNEVVVEEHMPSINASQTVAVLSARDISQNIGKPLGELLQNLPGVAAIQTGPAIFKPVIHGLHSQRILILNNGIRQEGQQWGAEHAPEIDPFIASNILVIKDAGAIKYGTDALGGVVVVNPGDLPVNRGIGGKFHLAGATNGRGSTVSGLLEGGLPKGWGWRTHGTWRRSGDFHAPNYTLTNTGFREGSFSVAAGKHKDNYGFDIFFSHFQTTLGILRGSAVATARDLANALEREPPAFTAPFSNQIEQPRQEVVHQLLKLNGHWKWHGHKLLVQYGMQRNHRLEFDMRRGLLREIPALGFNLYTHTIDFEWEQTHQRGSRSWGVNAMLQDNNKVDGTQTIPFIPNYTNPSLGVFAVEKWCSGRWQFDAGARYDWRDYRIVGFDFMNRLFRAQNTFHNVSGTLGALLQIGKNRSFHTTLGSTWRPPNVAELYSFGTHQSTASIEFGLLLDEVTSQVQPLTADNFRNEQALKWVGTYSKKSDRWQFEWSAYANYIFNYIYLRPRGVTESLRGIFPYFRYAQTDALFAGADATAETNLGAGWSARLRLSYLHARDVRANDMLIFIPPNRADLALRYERPTAGAWSSFFVEIKPRYVMRQFLAPRVVTVAQLVDGQESGLDVLAANNRIFDFLPPPPAYFWLGGAIGISRKVGGSRIDLRCTVENALNNSFREYTNRMRYFADEIGRNINFSASVAF